MVAVSLKKFFFKQKTAYEIQIRDWSSDVCSSDLILGAWRLLRCNPWSHGGVDHVPARGRWKPEAWVPPDDWAGHDNWERPAPMGLDPEHDLTE